MRVSGRSVVFNTEKDMTDKKYFGFVSYFAALLLISLAGIALFGVMSWVSRRALSAWHESEAVQSH